jgi:UDP-4-keto-D-FucNAc 4-reductase
MNILVTGASGFVGNVLLKKIESASITAVSRTAHKNTENIHWVKSSLEELIKSDIISANRFETVIHLAAIAHPTNENVALEEYQEINCEQTIALAEKSSDCGMKRFVFVSSIGVNGSRTEKNKAFTEDSFPSPHSDYAVSKYDAELKLKALAKIKNFEIVIIRPPLVYGKNAPGNFGRLYNIISKGMPLPFGLINNKRSFISVNNLCDFIAITISHPEAANQLFLIADDHSISTRELVVDIWHALNIKSFMLPVPAIFMRVLFLLLRKSNFSTQLLDNLEVENDKAKQLLSWQPKETLLEHFKQP